MRGLLAAVASGGFGGMFSSLVIIASALTNQPDRVKGGAWVLTFCLGLMIWGFLGAAVSGIFRETDLRKAFFLGIGLPALLQARNIADSKATPIIPPPNIPNSHTSLFISTAYASPQEGQVVKSDCAPGQARSLRLYGTSGAGEGRIVFYSADRKQAQSTALSKFPEMSNARAIPVPAFAEGFLIHTDPARSNSVSFGNDTCGEIHAEAAIDNNPWSGFWFALGFTSTPTSELKVRLIDAKAKK
jgi:hypothetical protein